MSWSPGLLQAGCRPCAEQHISSAYPLGLFPGVPQTLLKRIDADLFGGGHSGAHDQRLGDTHALHQEGEAVLVADSEVRLDPDHSQRAQPRLFDDRPQPRAKHGQPGPGERFDELLSVMIAARDEGLIGAIGLSNITRGHLLRALERTEIACVQNAFSLIDRRSAPVLRECTSRGIAFVPFFSLRSPFAPPDQVLGHQVVQQAAERLGRTPAQIALAWMLSVAPNVLLVPGTSSVRHLEENLEVAAVELDEATREQLNAVAP